MKKFNSKLSKKDTQNANRNYKKLAECSYQELQIIFIV